MSASWWERSSLKVEVPSNPICLAIDTPHKSEIQRLVASTRDSVGMFKLGLTSIYGVGVDVIGEIDWQRPLFLDAKLHDIPAQVRGATDAMRGLGAGFVTVHASGGSEMVRAAVEGAGGELAVLAVTILTSLNRADLGSFGFDRDTPDVVARLGSVAIEAGAHGLVCSAHEVADLRSRFGPRSEGGPVLVVPGIRPPDAGRDDQQRTMTPREALDRGADILVIGRPISAADDAAEAARRIHEGLAA